MQKVILISGANRGIGQAIAKTLHQAGYLLSLGVRNPESSIEGLTISDSIKYHAFDASNKDTAEQWIQQTLNDFGRIDALVNCAGILRPFFIDDDENILDEMWDVNVKGTLRTCKAALPHLQQAGEGRIINLVSMSGKRVKGKNVGYAMTKYAQLALTHGLKNIGWEDGVRVCAICPSWVNTEMAETHSSMAADDMTQTEDVALLVKTVIELPNTAAIGDLTVNCNLE